MCCPISVDFASFTQISFGQKGTTVGSTLLFKFFSGTFRGHGFTAPSPYHATKITLHQPGWNPPPARRDRGRVASSSWPGQVFPVLRRCSPWPLGNPRGHGWCIPGTGHVTTVPNLDPEIEEKMPIATWRDVFYLSVSIYIYLDLSMSIYIYLYLSISIYIHLYLPISIYFYLYLSISIYIYVYLSISIYIYLCLSISISIYLYLSVSIYIYLAYWRAWVYHLIIPMLSKIIFPSQNCSQHPIDPYIYIHNIYIPISG